jgi:ketosteroid isomerase-like protein
MRRLVAVMTFVLLIATAQAQPGDMTKSLQSFCDTFDSTWNNKGAAAVGQYFKQDAILIPPTGAIVKGRTAIADLFRRIYSHGQTTHRCLVQSATTSGDGVWGYGEATVTGTPASHARWAAYDLYHDGKWRVQMLAVIPIQQTTPAHR